jgi:hypothetical protein
VIIVNANKMPNIFSSLEIECSCQMMLKYCKAEGTQAEASQYDTTYETEVNDFFDIDRHVGVLSL